MMIGGEHLVSLPVVEALAKKYPDLHIIHFDAHTDLRDEFFGRKLSHATVMRRVFDIVGKKKIFQFGIRSGDSSEFKWADAGNITMRKFDLFGVEDVVAKIKSKPVYITIDIDVLDPAAVPGTGTPEPGGVTYRELIEAIMKLRKLNNIVGADIVELAPNYDPSGASTAAAAKTLREMVLLLHK
jgi:agmatinase